MKSALTIGGSDPSGGAGLQADLKVFKVFGVHGLSVPAALTAQSTTGVAIATPVERDFFRKQLDTLLEDIRPDALKTGMLYSVWAVEAVSHCMKAFGLTDLVIDPVTVSSSGASLVDYGTLDGMREALFPLARVITPNIYEASVLTGINIEGPEDMKKAAASLKSMGAEIIVVTGGHLEDRTLDLYYDGDVFHELDSAKISGEYHGTGCAFSAAITACLALGYSPLDSVKRAKRFTTEAIRNAYRLGRGMALLDL